jgi:sigma-B regulation protein RsbU (phosphoserine phosphatase)
VVESLASQAAVVLHNQILHDRQEALKEFQRQLEIGRQIQAGFFPAELPQPPGWEITAHFRPAREVAGDFYDAFLMPQGKVALVIADVCDKGLAAALFMSLVRSLIRAFSQHHYLHQSAGAGEMTPDGDVVEERPFSNTDFNTLLDTLMRTNAYIEANHRQSNMFATLFFAILNPKTGHLSYINAGHNPPVVFDVQGVKTFLRPTGPAVGLQQDVLFEVHQTTLKPGDTLLAYTDGVTEARNPIQQSFTMERLLALIPSYAHSATALLTQINEQVRRHVAGAELYDDITLLAVRHIS